MKNVSNFFFFFLQYDYLLKQLLPPWTVTFLLRVFTLSFFQSAVSKLQPPIAALYGFIPFL